MSSSVITVAIICTILALLAVAFLVQMRERSRDERVRQINSLVERRHRLRALLDLLPPTYISQPVRVRLLERLIESSEALRAVQKEAVSGQDLEQAKAELTAARQAVPATNTDAGVPNEQRVNEIRSLLKALYRFIEIEHQERRLDARTAQQNLAETAFLIGKTAADVHVSKAKVATSAGKYRVAIDHYHNAIDAMAKLQEHPSAQQRLLDYRRTIKELDRLASGQPPAAPEPAPTPVKDEDANVLSAQWDRLMSEEDKWKKRKSYDD